MVRVLQVVLGVDDMSRAVAFWSGLLGLRVEGEAGPWWTTLISHDGSTRLGLQRSTAECQDFPRVHLDLAADDAAEQAALAEAAERLGGARVHWPLYPPDPDFVVLADTEGNRFCVVDVSRGRVSCERSSPLARAARRP